MEYPDRRPSPANWRWTRWCLEMPLKMRDVSEVNEEMKAGKNKQNKRKLSRSVLIAKWKPFTTSFTAQHGRAVHSVFSLQQITWPRCSLLAHSFKRCPHVQQPYLRSCCHPCQGEVSTSQWSGSSAGGCWLPGPSEEKRSHLTPDCNAPHSTPDPEWQRINHEGHNYTSAGTCTVNVLVALIALLTS